MNKKFLILLVIGIFFGFTYGIDALAFSGNGLGTEGSPYEITNCGQLQEVENNLGAHYIITEDIDCSGVAFEPIGSGTFGFPGPGPFYGTLNGQGNWISNLTIEKDDSYVGLFGSVQRIFPTWGIIENVNIVDANIKAIAPVDMTRSSVGILAGRNVEGHIDNCHVYNGRIETEGFSSIGGLVGVSQEWWGVFQAEITRSTSNVEIISDAGGYLIGGFIGINNSGSRILYSFSTGDIYASSADNVGGFVGSNWSLSLIEKCYSTGSVQGNHQVGGFVGNNRGTINYCFTAGHEEGRYGIKGEANTVQGNHQVGGFVGVNDGTDDPSIHAYILNSYSLADVEGSRWVGGFAGTNGLGVDSIFSPEEYELYRNNPHESLINVYSAGTVQGDYAGGLVGLNQGYGTVENSFWDEDLSGLTESGGTIWDPFLASPFYTEFYEEPKETEEMKKQETFTDVGWSFENEDWTWQMIDGVTCPGFFTNPSYLDPEYTLTAVINCDPSSCDVYEGSLPFLTLNSAFSTEPEMSEITISSSSWYIDGTLYSECLPSEPLCSFVPQNYGVGIGSYTAWLEIEDSEGEQATTTRSFTIRENIRADFMCSVDETNWEICYDLSVVSGDTLYVVGNNSSLDRYSQASEGASITDWQWRLNGSSFGTNPSAETTSFPVGEDFEVRLDVIDSAGRDDNQTYTIRGVPLPLPRWREIAPF